jgi:hypothetical protein
MHKVASTRERRPWRGVSAWSPLRGNADMFRCSKVGVSSPTHHDPARRRAIAASLFGGVLSEIDTILNEGSSSAVARCPTNAVPRPMSQRVIELRLKAIPSLLAVCHRPSGWLPSDV